MDPKVALKAALNGDPEGKRNYNRWARNGGFKVRVEVDPGTDLWMAGVSSALVTSVGTKWVHIERGSGRWKILPGLVEVKED